MAAVNELGMLDADQLNDVDHFILGFLQTHEYATPNLIRVAHAKETGDEKSRQWISDRIRRLEEHGHIARVHPDVAERYLVIDPREEDPDAGITASEGADREVESPLSDRTYDSADELLDEEAPD